MDPALQTTKTLPSIKDALLRALLLCLVHCLHAATDLRLSQQLTINLIISHQTQHRDPSLKSMAQAGQRSA